MDHRKAIILSSPGTETTKPIFCPCIIIFSQGNTPPCSLREPGHCVTTQHATDAFRKEACCNTTILTAFQIIASYHLGFSDAVRGLWDSCLRTMQKPRQHAVCQPPPATQMLVNSGKAMPAYATSPISQQSI